jgi:peptide/nickel transport system permease protein
LAGFLAPYDYAEQHREYPLAPPARIHFGPLPFVYALVPDTASGGYREDTGRRYAIHLLPPPENGAGRRLFGVEPGGTVFLCGTDALGRDVFSRVLYAGRISLAAGLAAAILSLLIGMAFGILSGYCGGWVDQVLMRSGELVMAVPWLYLVLAVRSFLPLHIEPWQAFGMLIAIIGGARWARPARLVRGVTLSGREEPFVLAARGFGAGPWYLIRRHLAGLALPVLLTQATVLIPQDILAEVSLSFLGLGITEPMPSWGNMLADARQYHVIAQHTWLLLPGLASIPVLLGYMMLADALGDNR